MKSFATHAAAYIAGFATLFALMLIFGDYEETPAPTVAPIAVAQEVQASTSGPTFEQVCEVDESSMTDPQIAEYAKRFINQTVTGWRGWVYDVTSLSDGTYNLEISTTERGLLWSRQIVLENIPADLATRLNVEQAITFSGRIARNEVFLEGICNPLVLDNYTVQ